MFIFETPPLPLDVPTLSAPMLRYASTVQAEDRPAKPNTFWIFGPFGLEHQIAPKDTVGAYLTIPLRDDADSTVYTAAFGLEYMRYSDVGAHGFGFGVRALAGSGFGVGPSIAYVTRPSHKGVGFRLGASFPFGGGYVPFLTEIGLGFRF